MSRTERRSFDVITRVIRLESGSGMTTIREIEIGVISLQRMT